MPDLTERSSHGDAALRCGADLQGLRGGFVKTLALLACCLLLFAHTLEAQIAPCSGVQDPGTKILLDEDRGLHARCGQPAATAREPLDAGLLQVQTELGLDLNLKVLPCANRKPTGPADFTDLSSIS
jgi:hypothetical protein